MDDQKNFSDEAYHCWLIGKRDEIYKLACRALEENKEDDRSIFLLAECYANGYGVEKDYFKAIKLYVKANRASSHLEIFTCFRKIERDCDGEIFYSIGKALEEGDELPQDIIEAVKWYRRASMFGYEEANKRLEEFYNNVPDGYIVLGTYPQYYKADGVSINELVDEERKYYRGSDGFLYYEDGSDERKPGESRTNHYCKVEPILWKTFTDGNEIVAVATEALDRRVYGGENYAESRIRSWLNNKFYNKAFTESDKDNILTSIVDNSVASTGNSQNPYACRDTCDKVYLLSYTEVIKYFDTVESRKLTGSHFAYPLAYAFGCKSRDSKNGISTRKWWLRSTEPGEVPHAQYVGESGRIYISDGLRDSLEVNGVVPVIRLKGKNFNFSDKEVADKVGYVMGLADKAFENRDYNLAIEYYGCAADYGSARAKEMKELTIATIERAKTEAEEEFRVACEKAGKEAQGKDFFAEGNYRDLGDGYIILGMYPQSLKPSDVDIAEQYDIKEHSIFSPFFLGTDACLYIKAEGRYFKFEPVKWQILDREEMIVISDKIIDISYFARGHNDYWNSKIRDNVNNSLHLNILVNGEQRRCAGNVMIDGSEESGMFLLSREEVERYLSDEQSRKKIPTDFVAIARHRPSLANNDDDSDKKDGKGCGPWWLRSPGQHCDREQLVCGDGTFDEMEGEYFPSGVAPAMKLSVEGKDNK